jgi:hypothetical protein
VTEWVGKGGRRDWEESGEGRGFNVCVAPSLYAVSLFQRQKRAEESGDEGDMTVVAVVDIQAKEYIRGTEVLYYKMYRCQEDKQRWQMYGNGW